MHSNKHPVIFLDVDGVIATPRQIKKFVEEHRYACPPGYDQIDPECMNVLARIVYELDARVVVTSTWRKSNRDMFDLMRAFSRWAIPFVGVTPVDPQGIRENEIMDYMAQNELDIDDILVIDDSVKDLTMFESRQIVTDGENGLSPLTDIDLAHSIIEGPYKFVILTEEQRKQLDGALEFLCNIMHIREAADYIHILNNNRVETWCSDGETYDTSSYSLTEKVRTKLIDLMNLFSYLREGGSISQDTTSIVAALVNASSNEQK